MKKEKHSIDTNEKMFLIMGTSWVIFLALVLGSIIILKNVRGQIDTMQIDQANEKNYEVLKDGSKKNISDEIKNAEITINDVEFSHFVITEKEENIVAENMADSDIFFEVTNHGATASERKTYVIVLYDSEDAELTRFSLNVGDLPVEEPILFRQNLGISCVTASRVEVEEINMKAE